MVSDQAGDKSESFRDWKGFRWSGCTVVDPWKFAPTAFISQEVGVTAVTLKGPQYFVSKACFDPSAALAVIFLRTRSPVENVLSLLFSFLFLI